MIIFPLSWPGKIVLMLLAIFLGLILWMMVEPERWKRWIRGKGYVPPNQSMKKEPPILYNQNREKVK